MVEHSNIDYVSTIFEYPALTKITGQPDYPTLKRIKDELKANAASVPSDLGGGNHGHLGIVLTPQEYTQVSEAHPYIRPIHPGSLTIAPGIAQHAAHRMRE